MRALLIFLALPLLAATDQTCMQNCLGNGYLYQYCQSQCSYEPAPAPRRIDYTCMQTCTAKGYLYAYCQSLCSY